MPWGLGGGGWGLGPWGAGFLSLTSARAVAENRIRATFDLPLNLSGLLVGGPGGGQAAVVVPAQVRAEGPQRPVRARAAAGPVGVERRVPRAARQAGAARARHAGQLQGLRLPAGEAGHAGPPARGGAGDAGLAAGRRHGGLRVRRGD